MACQSPSARRLFTFALLTLLLPSGLRAQAPVASPAPPAASPNSPAGAGGGAGNLLASKPVSGALFSEIQLRDLPSARTLWSLIETADQLTIVDRIENGGLYLGEPKLLGNVGSSWTQTGFALDGLDVTNPGRTGTPLMYPDPQLLESLQVVTSLPAVDLAGGGPSVLLVPRAPARRWGGSLQGAYLPNGLQASGLKGAAPAIAHFQSAGEGSALLSGPLSSAAGLLVSARRASSRRFERRDPTPLDGRLTSIFLHSTFTRAAGGRLRVLVTGDEARHPFAGRLRFADRAASSSDRLWHLHAVWEQATASGTTWSLAGGYERGFFGAPDDMPDTTLAVVERLRDGPVPETALVSAATQQRVSEVLRVRPDLSRVAGGRHSVDLGLSLAGTTSTHDPMPRAVIGELVEGLPARAWDYTWGGTARRSATEFSVWANDRFVVLPRLTLEGGVRFEATRATARDNETGINWQTVLPRGLLRVNLTSSGSVSAHLGYGMYRHRLPLDYLAYGDTSAPFARVYRWTDPNADRQLQLAELGTLVALSGPGRRSGYASAVDPDLRPPRSDEFSLGFEARLGRRWRARLTGIERQVHRSVAPVNTGVTLDDYTARDIWDRGNDFLNPVDDRPLRVYDRNPASFGHDQPLLTNAPADAGHQVALDLAFERLFDGRWYMLFGATAQRSDGYAGNPGFLANENDAGVLGALFMDPNAHSYARGRLFFERGYIIKWSGGFVTGNDLHFGAIARYQDGQHFARLAIVPDLNQGPEAIQAYTRGHSRFTFTFTLDARLEKGFRVGSQRVALVAEAFNLLNNAIEVEEDPVVTRSFRATTAVQPPRAIRLGARFDF